LGACDGDVKRFEAETAVEHGALELDVVINLGRLKDGDDRYVLRELRDVVEAADGLPVKAILETGMLARDEKTRGCHLAVEAGCQFVKTSTGFLGPGATVADVALLRETVGPKVGVKASGGIRTLEIARQMLAAGASRIGTSAATAILEELEAREASL
jgi:deoxyribose-phosphate aldolase